MASCGQKTLSPMPIFWHIICVYVTSSAEIGLCTSRWDIGLYKRLLLGVNDRAGKLVYLSEVEIQVSNKASGVLFMTTVDNHAATISIELGSIVGLSYSFLRGMRAVDHICSASISSFSFNPIATIIPTNGLDKTEKILSLLKSGYVENFEQKHADNPSGGDAPEKFRNREKVKNASKGDPHYVANTDSSLYESLLGERVVRLLTPFVTGDVLEGILGAMGVGRNRGVAEYLAILKNSLISRVDDKNHHKKIMELCEQSLDVLNSESISNIYKLELLEYLGPMTYLIFEEEMAKHERNLMNYADLEHLLYILAAEICDENESDEYIKNCLVSVSNL